MVDPAPERPLDPEIGRKEIGLLHFDPKNKGFQQMLEALVLVERVNLNQPAGSAALYSTGDEGTWITRSLEGSPDHFQLQVA
jgi:hypothetical protein